MTHGNATHGMFGTSIYRAWAHAKDVGAVPLWDKFETFYADVGDAVPGRLLFKRRLDEPYGPDNWQWATAALISRNRPGFTRKLIHKETGITATAAEWARVLGIPKTSFMRYLGPPSIDHGG